MKKFVILCLGTLLVSACDAVSEDDLIYAEGTDEPTQTGDEDNTLSDDNSAGKPDPPSTCDPAEVVSGTLCDPRDGKSYRTVQVGDREWMAENLDHASAGLCFDDAQNSCETYGRLYSWMQATQSADSAMDRPIEDGVFTGASVLQGICPPNWHLPSNSEMEALRRVVSEQNPEISEAAALKSQNGWHGAANGLDTVGLNFLPGGWYLSGAIPVDLGKTAMFWVNPAGFPSDTFEDALNKPIFMLDSQATELELTWYFYTDLASVRCIKDTVDATGDEENTDTMTIGSDSDADSDADNATDADTATATGMDIE